jgi:hypothetical protein
VRRALLERLVHVARALLLARLARGADEDVVLVLAHAAKFTSAETSLYH